MELLVWAEKLVEPIKIQGVGFGGSSLGKKIEAAEMVTAII